MMHEGLSPDVGGEVASPEEPGGPDAGGRRSWGVVALGAAMILAFWVPLVGTDGDGWRVVFLFKVLTEGRDPGLYTLFLVYPFVAGVITLLMGFSREQPKRGITLLILWAVPVAAVVPQVWRAWPLIRTRPDLWRPIIVGLMAAVGMILLLGSLRVLRHCPDSRGGWRLGAAGTTLCLMSLLLPVLPRELGLLPVLYPFVLLRQYKTLALGVTVLLQMAVLVGVSIQLVVIPLSLPEPEQVQRRATLCTILLLFGMTLGLVANSYLAVPTSLPLDIDAEQLRWIFQAAFRTSLLFATPHLLLSMGLSDVMIYLAVRRSLAPKVPLPPPEGFSVADDAQARLKEQLEELNRMRTFGLISEEEFQQRWTWMVSSRRSRRDG